MVTSGLPNPCPTVERTGWTRVVATSEGIHTPSLLWFPFAPWLPSPLHDAFGPLCSQALQKVKQRNWQKPVKNEILGLYSKSCKQTSPLLPQRCCGWPATTVGTFNLLSHVTFPWAWGYVSTEPQRSQPDLDSIVNIISLRQVVMWSPSGWVVVERMDRHCQRHPQEKAQ